MVTSINIDNQNETEAPAPCPEHFETPTITPFYQSQTTRTFLNELKVLSDEEDPEEVIEK